MSELYNVYCDESCHLENDRQPFMVLGAIWCPVSKRKEIAHRLREIRQKHGLNPRMEIKWTSVSPAKLPFYLDILDYFFDDDDLHFRGVVADKRVLNHEQFGQDHDTWYYKMYFTMLKAIFDPQAHYRIYLDIKDTQGGNKVHKLHEVLCNTFYDFSQHIVQRVQLVESKHVDHMQLADLRNETRILLWLEELDYLVVLADRGNYILPWTAYCVDKEHKKRKLQKEYQKYWQDQGGRQN